MNGEQQTYDDNTCAKIFLTWLGGEQDVEWTFVRAENAFPELANRTRWEFVAHRADRNNGWIAIEVKSLVFPEGQSQHGSWRKLVDDVHGKLGGRLPAKYWLAYLPKYAFDQSQRKTLVDCLKGTILDAAKTLTEGEHKDIGPTIAACVSHWPKDTRRQPTGFDPKTLQLRYPPHPLLLIRGSGAPGSLGIGIYPFVGYWVKPTLKKAIIGLFKGKGKANAQLGLARDKGAARTVLLFDGRIDNDPGFTSEVIGSLDTSHLSNIDEIYLVSTISGPHVAQVWSDVG